MNILSITSVPLVITGRGSRTKSFASADAAHCRLMSRLPAKMGCDCRWMPLGPGLCGLFARLFLAIFHRPSHGGVTRGLTLTTAPSAAP